MKLVFAGTKMGREFVEELLQNGEKVIVSTATTYGASLYKPHKNLTVNGHKMNLEEMKNYIDSNKIDEIIDVTHPYAVNVTENMIKCARKLNIPYRVIERDSFIKENNSDGITIMNNYVEACDYLLQQEGNILLAIGSNNLETFKSLDPNRVLIRVLPTSQVLLKCETLGYNPKNIIGMQGPFSYEFNKTLYSDYCIKYLVTKDSGKSGGVVEKVKAALDSEVEVIMITR
ncbi:precorrin-6A reductase [Alkalibaculum sp. M08DMB]|uniref:Precorrin-6A reductase n=1 Tax=Alkalibaculum sporogenes TaxID=2655001 RepID=A0A6A7K9S9_9FIRM|nr:precorrin-6A reductase [Alkalibaculum sporogenes]MPW26289.1 precorrin-6A reductase [Alkalibaculum sporogenes]